METIGERKSVNLLTLREAEHILKRRVSTLRKDIARRRIPYVRVGRQIRIPREVIEQMISTGWHESVEGVN